MINFLKIISENFKILFMIFNNLQFYFKIGDLDDSRDNIDLCFSKRTELSIENNSDCKMDSLKNIFLVQLYTNPREFYFNFKSEAIIKNMEEIEHLDTEESEQKEIKT